MLPKIVAQIQTIVESQSAMLRTMVGERSERRSIISSSLTSLGALIIVIVALWWLVRVQQPSDELNVYDAVLLAMAFDESQVVLISAPDQCELAEEGNRHSAGLRSDFLSANSSSALPISLFGLEGAYRYVSHERSLRSHPGSAASLKIDEPWVGLSRVGFHENTALLCVSGSKGEQLFSLVRAGGQWKLSVPDS